VRKVTGGLWAHTHALHVDTGARTRERWALRRYVRWQPDRGRDTECARQQTVLPVLHGSGVPVPELLWADPDGEVLDVPALLTTLLPGRSSLTVASTGRGPELLAGALAAVHRVDAPAGISRGPFADWARAAVAEHAPEWLEGCPLAVEVLGALGEGIGAADQPEGLRHGDFHAGNVLWTGRGRGLTVSGVVDWDVAGTGPAGADVGYCRADLAMACGQPAAEAFGDAYRRLTGGPKELWWWDLLAVASIWSEFPSGCRPTTCTGSTASPRS
jgi:aminoglycoside phosphotransferase (APT) family kinase protein